MCVPSAVVRAPAQMAGAPARVAPNKRRVEAETGDQDAEQGQAQPPDAKVAVCVAAAARVHHGMVTVRVGDAVIVKALGARQT